MKHSTLSEQDIQNYEQEALLKREKDPYKLKFHLMPPSGRLNDPNGLSEINGLNHIFFQYTPQDIKKSSTLAWGHYFTPDFIHYTYVGPGILPDTQYETQGSYSGSVINGPEGPRAYYTGNVKHPGEHDYISSGREQNVIMADEFDGKKFNKKELIMTNTDYPDNLTLHVRDPKVFFKDGKWMMLLGARTKDDIGALLVYESPDGKDWKLQEQIIGNEDLGYMWECPDQVTINDKAFILLSPQGIKPLGERFKNTDHSVWLEREKLGSEITRGDLHELDYGFDFYAPQTYTDENGRVILIGWMGLPEAKYDYLTKENGWIHALTIPRMLKEKNGMLLQEPLSELKELRSEETEYNLNGEKLVIETPEIYELSLKTSSSEGKIIIKESCVFEWKEGKASLYFLNDAGAGRDLREAKINKMEDVRIFVDTSSIEIFINDGAYTFTSFFFPNTINTLTTEGIKGELKIWNMNPFEISRIDGSELYLA